MTFDLRMAVFSGGRLTAAQQAQELLSCNDDTAAYGLRLTPQQAQALLDTRSAALRKTGRVELGGTILRRMILTFRDSPYLTAENYEATLHELVDAFYHFKTETEDRGGDEALLRDMQQLLPRLIGTADRHRPAGDGPQAARQGGPSPEPGGVP